MHSRVRYNQITENVQKALLLSLDLLCLICQRSSAAFPRQANMPFSGLHGCVARLLRGLSDHPAGAIKGVH